MSTIRSPRGPAHVETLSPVAAKAPKAGVSRRAARAEVGPLAAGLAHRAPGVGAPKGKGEAEAPAALRARDFAAPLTREVLASAKDAPSAKVFEESLASALDSPMMLFRSYPGAFWRDVAGLSADQIPGGLTIGLGDGHPNNFGFMQIGERTIFSFNDLDDSGKVPVALDAARYFTGLRLFFDDPSLTKKALKLYAEVVRHPDRAVTVDPDSLPKWRDVRAEQRAHYVEDGELVKNEKTRLEPVSAAERDAVERVFASAPELAGRKILDVATLPRDYGGSAGLKRYRVLVRTGTIDRILELKAAAEPGVNQLGLADPLGMEERLALLKKTFWGSADGRDDLYVMLDGQRYLVRDRSTAASVDVTKLKKKELERTILAQVSVMARIHAEAWDGVKRSDMREWLGKTSKVLAERWGDLYDDLEKAKVD